MNGRPLTLLWRIRVLAATVIAVVSLFGLAMVIYERVHASQQEFRDTAHSIVLALMPMLRNALVAGDLAVAQQTFDAIVQQETISRIALLSPTDGRTVVESIDPVRPRASPEPPQWFARLIGTQPLVTAEPIVVGGTDYGTVQLEISRVKLIAGLWGASLRFFLVGVLCLVGIVIVLSLVLRRGLEPLHLVTESARRLAAGDWSERIPAVGVPEVAVVANAFNQMAEDIVRREADLVRAKDAAEAANRAKATFLGTMSHEIRTPLNGIIGMTDLILATNPTAEQRGYLELAKSSADELLAILNAILDYSNIDSGHLQLTNSTIDLKDMANEVMEQFAFRCRNKGLATTLHFDPDPPPLLRGDAGRLNQSLTNLYANAVKFTPAGSVALAVTTRDNGRGGYHVDLDITDSGIGIDSRHLEHVFDPFYQADGALTRRYGGVGLGLAISRRLIEMMGGRLTVVKSTPGAGSTFRVSLDMPAAPASSVAPAPGNSFARDVH